MLDRCHKKRLLEQLLFKYSKRNLSQKDYAFTLDPKSGQLALQFNNEKAMSVSADDVRVAQRSELVPWLVGLPILFDPTVSFLCICFAYWLAFYGLSSFV